MFLHETVQHCATCDEVTPHSRRSVAGPRILGALAILAGAACFSLESPWWVPGGAAILAGTYLLAKDREGMWRIACERCRGKKLVELRRTRPTLDGNTEV